MKVYRQAWHTILFSAGLLVAAHGQSMAGDGGAGSASTPMEILLPEARRSLEALLPGGLRLTKVAIQGSKVALSGLAETTAQISVYLHTLGREAAFKNPALIQVQKDRATGLLKFDMEMEVTCSPPAGGGGRSLCKPSP